MRYRPFIVIGSLLLLICLAAFYFRGLPLQIKTSEGAIHRVLIEVMRTDEEKRLGLMNRESLKEGRGMLFVYEAETSPIMWMRNMKFPIDIVFIGKNLRINHIEQNAQPCEVADDSQCARYRSSELSLFVLELPAGYTARHQISSGDKIRLPSGF